MTIVSPRDNKTKDFIKRVSHNQQLRMHSVEVEFNQQAYSNDLFDVLNVSRPDSIIASVEKRQSEFLAGRYAAQLALIKLGIVQFDVNIGPQRNPIWPTEIMGSISHTTDRAICTVMRGGDTDYLGIDIENWLSDELAQEIKNSIISSEEEALLLALSLPFAQALTIAFSAKESLYKALYPKVNQFFGFESAKILKIDASSKTFSLALSTDLPGKMYRQGQVFTGSLIINSKSVQTVITSSMRLSSERR